MPTILRFLAGFGLLVLLGAGCWSRLRETNTGNVTTTLGYNTLGGAVTSTSGLVFTSNDEFTLHLASSSGATSTLRRVVLTNFVPRSLVELRWEDASSTSGAGKEQPGFKGTITGGDTQSSHRALLPVFWEAREVNALGEQSLIWLSDDAYSELVRTQKTLVETQWENAAYDRLFQNNVAYSREWQRLKEAARSQDMRQDVDLFSLGGEAENMTILINGQAQTVEVWRLRSWWGEMLVLRDRDNPVILKWTVNPSGVTNGAANQNAQRVKEMLSYEVTELVLEK